MDEENKKIINLSLIKNREVQLIDGRKPYSSGNCKHRRFLIDSKKALVECADCGDQLNPMWVLETLCDEETRYMREKKRYSELLDELRKRSKCKCNHCGKFTDIKP